MSKEKDQNQKPVVSQRFVNEVERQFAEEMGESLNFTDYEKKLAQHIYLQADQQLEEFEQKRVKREQKSKTPYTWANVNLKGLALDAVFKVSLGLDALMKNHLHPIPYYNKNNGNYDLDLQTGYKGLKFIAKKYAIDPPKDIIAEIVYENDKFIPLKKSHNREVETYEFEIPEPFNRGEITGGFGYIFYDDQTKNKLVLIRNEDFDKAKAAAPTKNIWEEWPEKMRYKTILRRTIDRIDLDPEKANAKALMFEETGSAEKNAKREIAEKANEEIIDLDENGVDNFEGQKDQQIEEEQESEQKEEPPQQEKKERSEAEDKKESKQMALNSEGPEF